MKFERSGRFNRITAGGVIALAVANIASFLLQRHTSLSEHVTDPVIGFLYGVAIMTTLLGVWRQGRELRGQRCVRS